MEAKAPEKSYAYENRRLVETGGACSRLRHLDGACPYVWRQGVKHDLAKIVEPEKRDGSYFNRLNRHVDVESECVYPLLNRRTCITEGP